MKGVNKSIVPIFAAVLYLLVHFVSDFGGADVMGAQWLYTAVLDLLILGYVLFNTEKYKEAIANVYKHKFSLLYSFFVLWALGSYFYAINPTEALVCLGRLVSTYFIFINLSILFYQQDYKWLFNIIAFVITGILVYDSLFVLSKFSSNLGELNLDQNILSLMGNHGNKNVMAANLLIKLPFCLYIILESKIAGKAIGFIGLTIGLLCLFILNTRSTFVGIGLIFLMYVVFILLQKGIKEIKNVLIPISFFLIPILVAFLSSNAILSNALKLQDASGVAGGDYGLVSERIKTINIKDNENSRIHLWKSAADYIIHHPLIGDGYGNWKLASIPYEKELANELFVPYHSHNDFLENAADLGIIGGLAFVGLFILLLFYTIKSWKDPRFNDYKFIVAICFLAITCYGVDALLNFPAERTAMQTMFTMTAALMYIPFFIVGTSSSIASADTNKDKSNNKGKHNGSQATVGSCNQKSNNLNNLIVFIYLVAAILLILPSIYIANQTYESLKIQKYVMGEINADPKYATDSAKALPNIPNLSTSALPIKALIARYHIRDKNYPEAIQLLNESYNDNPFIHYNDFLLTSIYAALGKYDSTLLYAKRAFYNWPRATSYYKNIMFAAVRNKDALELKKAFDTSVKYYNMPLTWEQYIFYELKSKTTEELNVLLDSAIKKFPGGDFNKTKAIINSGGVVVPNTTNFAVLGVQSYQKGKYAQAAEYYKKAIEVEPNNYTHYENVAICLYTVQKYDACIPYFEKASQFKENNTGKSEFFKAMALISIGKKDLACSSLQAAKVKGYAQADQYIKSNCQ